MTITNTDTIDIVVASSSKQFIDGAELFKEYAAAINFDAGFKDFDIELADLGTKYANPNGCLLLAYNGHQAIGCIAILKTDSTIAELKRFYVQPEFRQFKIGARLLGSAIEHAKPLRVHLLRLEVIPTLTKAKELYKSYGFYEIKPFKEVDMEGTAYMEINLLVNVNAEKLKESNPWNTVPLEDYERHMEHETVSQAQLLNSLTGNYLRKYDPESALFLGISGGNGLEHIDSDKTKEVYGIDVNQLYLDAAKKRYDKKIDNLVLINADVSTSKDTFVKADFIWAALIFEYIDMKSGFAFITQNSSENAILIVTIQSNNGNQSVSQTGVESIKSIKGLFKIVDSDKLQIIASGAGFEMVGSEENILPNGKSLITYEFAQNHKLIKSSK